MYNSLEQLKDKIFEMCAIYFERKPQKICDVYAFAERISKTIFMQSYISATWKDIAYQYAETYGFKIAT